MHATAGFLTALGQALATHGLYAEGHPMRETASHRVHSALTLVLKRRGPLRVSLLGGSVVVGERVSSEMRGWPWGARLNAVGVQRLEIDAVPEPDVPDIMRLIEALWQRLDAPAAVDGGAPVNLGGIRFGPVGVATSPDKSDIALGDLLDAMSELSMTEEASAMRWIHDEVATGAGVPMAEVEGIIHSLAAAMHREQHLILPLLAIKSHDQYTTTHSCNVSMLAIGLAEQFGLAPTDVREIGTAALLHDIGKVRVPVDILVKPGKLTDEEFELMRAHAVEGARILGARSRGHALAATVAYEHHIWENEKGGYPQMRWPRRCHFASRLVHVCDLYDALSTQRPYREAWPRERTMAMLIDRSGIEVDGEMVTTFASMLARMDEVRSPVADLGDSRGWSNDVEVTAKQLREAAGSVPDG